jgi:hypothetical protein
MSTGNGEKRWSQLARLAEKETVPEKLYAIVQELCTELTALENQLISAKLKYATARKAWKQRSRFRYACN